jgi:hypothetical protein
LAREVQVLLHSLSLPAQGDALSTLQIFLHLLLKESPFSSLQQASMTIKPHKTKMHAMQGKKVVFMSSLYVQECCDLWEKLCHDLLWQVKPIVVLGLARSAVTT